MRNVAREQADHVIFVYGSARRLSQAAATAPVNAPRGRPDPPFASGGDHYAENADAILGNWLGVRFEGKTASARGEQLLPRGSFGKSAPAPLGSDKHAAPEQQIVAGVSSRVGCLTAVGVEERSLPRRPPKGVRVRGEIDHRPCEDTSLPALQKSRLAPVRW